MLLSIYFCLLVFGLNSHVTAGEVTWSREKDGRQEKIVTTDGDNDIKHIKQSNFIYSTQGDKSLVISGITVSDSGRYFCNYETAVELTVIPSGTIIENVTEGSSISLRCPRDYGGSHVPERRRGLNAGRFDVSTEDKTLTIRNVKPKDSGLYYCDGKPDLYVNVSKRSDRGKKSTVATTTMTVPSTVQTKETTLSTVTTVSTPKPSTGMTTNKRMFK
ncbi:hemicentin-1-like [Cololabis saira]|uniref:hemicentin-1-like n=1 Tax=Cololabis saira TaxID=129043 RepID=UPI002AD47B97|nr:hemicentin-1-like [Cololabis saira]